MSPTSPPRPVNQPWHGRWESKVLCLWQNHAILWPKPRDVFQRFFFMEPKVAAYLRVSTENQIHDSQEAELREYCTRKGGGDVEWYRDTASGAQDRKGLNDLMQKVRRGKVDIILAFKLDRIARSLSHLAQFIAELQINRVALVCPVRALTLRTKSGGTPSIEHPRGSSPVRA